MPTGIGERRTNAMNLTELNDLIRATPWLTADSEDTIYSIANYIGSLKVGTVLLIGGRNGQPAIGSFGITKVGANNWTGGLPLMEGQNTRDISERIFWSLKHLGSSYEITKGELTQ